MSERDRHQLQPLLQRLLVGDRTALEELFVQLRPYMHALVREKLGPDFKDASDIVQSSMRRIHENLPPFLARDPTVPHLLNWIRSIVSNRAIDAVRCPKTAPGALPEQVPERLSQEERQQREERSLAVLAALAQLPERHRQVVELHYFERLRDQEISARLGGSVAAIRVLRCRALRRLRELMEADDAAQ